MTRQHHPVRAAAALAVLALAVAAMAVLGTTSTASAKHGPMYRAPKSGHCYKLSAKTLSKRASTTQHARPCRKAHTLFIAGVKKVPAKISMKKTSNTRLWKFIDKACTAKWTKRLGKLDRRFGLAAYARYALVPTKKQRAKGAHWVSCELGLLAGKNKIVTHHTKKPKKLSNHPPKSIRRCSQGKKKGYYYTVCTRKHAYQVKYAKSIKARAAKVSAIGNKFCKRKVKSKRWVWGVAWTGPAAGKKDRWVMMCLPKNGHKRVIAGAGGSGNDRVLGDAMTERHLSGA